MKVDDVKLNSVEEDADIKTCSRWKKYKSLEPFWYLFDGSSSGNSGEPQHVQLMQNHSLL
jgi:hypothetical protein